MKGILIVPVSRFFSPPRGETDQVCVEAYAKEDSSEFSFGSCSGGVPVVKDYPDVFPEELLGMPPDRDIEFLIELLPGTGPISKRPYRMPADDLEEIKKQIKESLEKGHIRQSSSL